MSKYGPSDTGVRPPLMLALTELFLAVEIAAEVISDFIIVVIAVLVAYAVSSSIWLGC